MKGRRAMSYSLEFVEIGRAAKGLAAFVRKDRIIVVCWLHAARGERQRYLELWARRRGACHAR